MSRFKPTIVLTCITTLTALLLTVTHTFTYVDTSGVITEKLMKSCTQRKIERRSPNFLPKAGRGAFPDCVFLQEMV